MHWPRVFAQTLSPGDKLVLETCFSLLLYDFFTWRQTSIVLALSLSPLDIRTLETCFFLLLYDIFTYRQRLAVLVQTCIHWYSLFLPPKSKYLGYPFQQRVQCGNWHSKLAFPCYRTILALQGKNGERLTIIYCFYLKAMAASLGFNNDPGIRSSPRNLLLIDAGWSFDSKTRTTSLGFITESSRHVFGLLSCTLISDCCFTYSLRLIRSNTCLPSQNFVRKILRTATISCSSFRRNTPLCYYSPSHAFLLKEYGHTFQTIYGRIVD